LFSNTLRGLGEPIYDCRRARLDHSQLDLKPLKIDAANPYVQSSRNLMIFCLQKGFAMFFLRLPAVTALLLAAIFVGTLAHVKESGASQITAIHAGQDLADAFKPEFTVSLAFLGSDKVEFTLRIEMLGVDTHAGQDMAAAFAMG
jgi:hypothetical protein